MKRYKHTYPLTIFSSQTGSPNIYIYFSIGFIYATFCVNGLFRFPKMLSVSYRTSHFGSKSTSHEILCLWVFDRKRERPTKNQSMETLRLAESLVWLWMQKLDLITRLSPWKQPSQKALFHQLSFASTCLTPLMGLGLSKCQWWFCFYYRVFLMELYFLSLGRLFR